MKIEIIIMPGHEQLGEVSPQFEKEFNLGKAIASTGPHVEYVPDPSVPPIIFTNGLEQLRYIDALGNIITLPLLDKVRAKLPSPASVIKLRREERQARNEGLHRPGEVSDIFTREVRSTAADSS